MLVENIHNSHNPELLNLKTKTKQLARIYLFYKTCSVGNYRSLSKPNVDKDGFTVRRIVLVRAIIGTQS